MSKELTSFLDTKWNKIPNRQRQWHIDNQIYDFVQCENCSNLVNWSVKNKKYSRFCSSKCAHNHSSVKEKIAATCLERYGARSNLSTEENKKKQQATCVKKYGVSNYAKTQEFKEKYKKTCVNKYGVENVSQLDFVKQKINNTHLKKYSRKRFSQVHLDTSVIDQKNNKEYMMYLYKDLKMPLTEIANQLGVNHSQLCVHFKQNLNIDISRHNVSWPETEIFNFVKNYANDAIQSDRTIITPKEIDISVPSKKLAIEYNGLAWHGEIRGGKSKFYHRDKMTAANAAGFRMIQVFSNEWENKRDLVKSRLINALGFSQKIPGRKCQIVSVNKTDTDDFLNRNHIQGMCFFKIAYGLIYNDELVAVMTFGKPRFNKHYDQELLRYACKQHFAIQGGASKLFKHFLNKHNPRSIISYCDLRWNNGNVYDQLGFKLQKTTDPNYWYVVNNNLDNRIKYQKHKLCRLLNRFDPSLTEWENMLNNGYDRVWDCGNSVWVYKC